jgi:2-oxo-4-hydroxy-4-carboxy--5-ureidoimidazoline (OHCU) decarboxylase
VKGVVRVQNGWVQFHLAGGNAEIAAFAPQPDERPRVMHLLDSSAAAYAARFGFQYVTHVPPDCTVESVIAAIADRMHNDTETERKVLRNEIAKVNRSRLERMLGPEGGYDNWA